MKALRILSLLALLLVVGGWFYWDQTRPEIPVRRTLVSEDGKSVEFMIVGKTGQTLHIERESDAARFEMRLGKLGWKDRLFAERLPEQKPPPVVVEAAEPEDPYIALRRKRIEELTRKRTEFVAEIGSGSLSDILTRKRQDDVIGIDKEIKELQAAIAMRQAQGR